MNKILCVTGHRPDKLGGYGETVQGRLVRLAKEALSELAPERVLCGMALGWDQAIAEAAHALQIPFTAYVPFPEQHMRWPDVARRRYQCLLAYADERVTISQHYTPRALLLRNEAMVRDCDEVLALFNGDRTGGTAHCVNFAERLGKHVHNVWDRWLL